MQSPRCSLFQVRIPFWFIVVKFLDVVTTERKRCQQEKKILTTSEPLCTPLAGLSTYAPILYRNKQQVGQGSHGVVTRAHEFLLNRAVVIKQAKISSRSQLAGSQREFCEECEMVKWLHSGSFGSSLIFGKGDNDRIVKCLLNAAKSDPSVIVLEDAGQDSMHFLYALRASTDSKKDELRWINHIIDEASRAVHYLASNGVMHRDLKPGNIAVSNAGEVKLIDFGMAIRAPTSGAAPLLNYDDALLHAFEWADYAYAPPEVRLFSKQLKEASYQPDQRILEEKRNEMRAYLEDAWRGNIAAFDLWSLGITLIEMVCIGTTYDVDKIAQSILNNYDQAWTSQLASFFSMVKSYVVKTDFEQCLKRFGAIPEAEKAKKTLDLLLSRKFPWEA
eukprot:TRINITY_DN19474_c0_g1_i1.p1 TRINITY_DN19474_c0_g1~~TRINITY_DN19474_c0_g1_i1.p1  ORF type:complete len:399 (+),score=50.02 TRINITY_DN19474_c0_g1_i1:29-1198(+)